MKIRLLLITDNELLIGLASLIVSKEIDFEYINIQNRIDIDLMNLKNPQLTIVNINNSIDSYPGLETIINIFRYKSKLYMMRDDNSHIENIKEFIENKISIKNENILHFNKELNEQSIFISNLINYSLSKRETEVLILITKGHSYKDIARELDLSIDTVRSHIKNIYSKLDVTSKSRAISKVLGYNTTV